MANKRKIVKQIALNSAILSPLSLTALAFLSASSDIVTKNSYDQEATYHSANDKYQNDVRWTTKYFVNSNNIRSNLSSDSSLFKKDLRLFTSPNDKDYKEVNTGWDGKDTWWDDSDRKYFLAQIENGNNVNNLDQYQRRFSTMFYISKDLLFTNGISIQVSDPNGKQINDAISLIPQLTGSNNNVKNQMFNKQGQNLKWTRFNVFEPILFTKTFDKNTNDKYGTIVTFFYIPFYDRKHGYDSTKYKEETLKAILTNNYRSGTSPKWGIGHSYLNQNINSAWAPITPSKLNLAQNYKTTKDALSDNLGAILYIETLSWSGRAPYLSVRYGLERNTYFNKNGSFDDYKSAGESFMGIGVTRGNHGGSTSAHVGLISHNFKKEITKIDLVTTERFKEETIQWLRENNIDSSKVLMPKSDLFIYENVDKLNKPIKITDINKSKQTIKDVNSTFKTKTTLYVPANKKFSDYKLNISSTSSKDWVYSANNGNGFKFNKASTTGLGNNAGQIDIVWDLSDYAKLNLLLENSKWLTAIQKETIKNEYTKDFTSDLINLKSNPSKNFSAWTKYINDYNEAQKKYEESYFNLYKKVLSDSSFSSAEPELNFISDKINFLFSNDQANKRKVISALTQNLKYAAFFSSEFNNNLSLFVDRKNVRDKNSLKSLDEIQRLTNQLNELNKITFSGYNYIKVEFDKLKTYEIISLKKNNQYNYKQALNFIKEAIKNASDFAKTSLLKTNNYNDEDTETFFTNFLTDKTNDFKEIINSIKDKNDFYKRLVNFQNNIQTLLNSSYYKDGLDSTYGGKTYADIFNQTFNSFQEEVKEFTGEFKNTSFNVFSSLSNLNAKSTSLTFSNTDSVSEHALTFKYQNLAKKLLKELSNVFGNGVKLAKEINQYQGLTQEQKNNLLTNTNNTTNSIVSNESFTINGKKVSIDNFTLDSNVAFRIIDNTSKVNSALLQFSNLVYLMSAKYYQAEINKLSNLSRSLKQKYSSLIAALINKNDIKIYKNDSDIKDVYEKAKILDNEQKRLNDLITTYESSTSNSPYYFDYIGKNIDVNNASLSNVVSSTDANLDVRINRLAIVETHKDTNSYSYIKVNYTLNSTKNLTYKNETINEILTSKVATSKEIGPFIYIRDTEIKKLEDLSTNIVLTYDGDKSKITPDKVDSKKIVFKYKESNGSLVDLTSKGVKVENVNFISNIIPDDLEKGNLYVSYTLVSTVDLNAKKVINANSLRNTYVSEKNHLNSIAISGFLKEKDRLNNILLDYSIIKNIQNIDNKNNLLASSIKANSIKFLALSPLSLEAKIDANSIQLSANDNNGTLTITYKLLSTKERLEKISSSKTNSIVIDGFLSILKQKQNEAIKMLETYSNINQVVKDYYKQQINNALDEVQISNILLEAYKQNISNNIRNVYQYLNTKQVSNLVDLINSQTSKEKVDEIFKAYKDNDDKMRQLKEKVNYYKNLLNNSSNEINYFYASNELKNNFNSTLNDASNLLISDVNDGTNSPNLTILLSNSHNSLDSLFNHLDGNKNFYSNQINEYNFLSQSEKNNFISELKAVDLDLGETKSLELIKNIVKKAKETNDYKENLFNNFETNYRNLNSAQISKYKNLIPLTNKSNLDQEIISKVSTYNANMAILKAKIAQIEKDVIKSDKYKFANNNRELDNILSIARELVASYVNVGEENPSLADLIGSKNLPNSLDNKYYSLDGNKVAALSKIQLYWFLSDAEKSTYSFYISTINLLSDQADENILNKFKEAEKTNQDKEQFFNGLPTKYSYLNNSQIYQYQDQIRNYNLSELENTIGSNAKELNEQMKALNDEILSELKALTKNNNIKDITSQEDKTLEKYVFANKEAKNSYNLSLEEAINLFNKFSGKNASLTEVKNLLANLKSNYSRLDGQNSIEKAKEIVNNLLNLSLKQKENVNKLIDSKNKDLAKANTVVSLADTIDKNLMQLEDKFKAIEKIKNQVIYSMDSTINKTNLDNNITKFQKLLSDVKANNFDNSNEDKLRKIRNDLYEAIKTLDSNLANLSGNKIALKNDLAKFSLLTDDKLDQLKNKVDNFSAEISEKQKNDILSEALESSKATALAQLETELYSAYLSKDEKTTFRDQIIKAQLTPNLSKYDNDIAVLLAQANDKNNQKAQTILEIKNLSNINDNQSEFFKNSIINSSTKNLKTYLDEAKLIDREMKEIKNITLDQLTQLTRKNITNFDSKIELIDGNYKFALENTKKAYDQVLNNVITLLNKAKGANLNLEALTNLKTELNTKFSALNGNDIVQANNLIIDFFVVINQNQKEQIKANISKLDNRNANNVINNLQEVDKLLISALNTINKASNAKKNNLYLKDNTVKKTTLDEALNALNSLVTNIKNTDFTSTKLEEILLLEDKINRANSNLLEAFNNLDGYRNSLISELNKYILISNDDKKLFLNEINNLPKALSDDLANSFWNKINNYVNSVALTNLSSNKLLNFNEINTFVNKINAIKIINDNISIPDQQYQDILNEASELNLQKNSYLKKLTNFSYLNNKQIEFLTNEIKNTNLNDLNNVVNLANDLNLLMQKLNDLVLNQLSELTNQTISDNQNNSPRITNNYKLSDLSLRNNYDDLLAYIQSVLVKNSLINASKDELNSLYENLTLKYKNLNGNDNLASLINKLEAISNFSKTQKDFLIAKFNNLANKNEYDELIFTLNSINEQIQNLSDLIKESEKVKESTLYLNETLEKQSKFSQSLEEAKNLLNSLNENIFDDSFISQLSQVLTSLEEKAQNLTNDSNNLDGIRLKLKTTIDSFLLLDEEQKSRLKEQINKMAKNPSSNEENNLLFNAFVFAKNNSQIKIAEFKNLGTKLLVHFIDKITKLELDTNSKEPLDQKISDLIEEAKKVNDEKNSLIQLINNSKSLNNKMLNYFVNSVIDNDEESNLPNIKNNAIDLENAMHALSEIETIDLENANYSQTSVNNKLAYQDALSQRNNLLDKQNGWNAGLNIVLKISQNLKDAKNSLDGNNRLNEVKNSLLTKFANSELSNLTAVQFTEAKAKIENSSSLNELRELNNNLIVLDNLMKLLKEYLTNSAAIKKTTNYLQANSQFKNDYDEQINSAKEALTNLENPNSGLLEVLDPNRIKDHISKISNAIFLLDGEKNNLDLRKGKVNEVRNLNGLNDNQKINIIALFDKTFDLEQIEKELAKAKKLDQLMQQLNISYQEKKSSLEEVKYLNASSNKREKYENIFLKITNLVDKRKGVNIDEENQINTLISELNSSYNELDGENILENSVNNAKVKINSLTNLNNNQKANFIDQLGIVKVVSEINNLVNKAFVLDDAMMKIKEVVDSIFSEINDKDNISYRNSSKKVKDIFDQEINTYKELVKANGLNYSKEEIYNLEKRIIDAKNNLDGFTNWEAKKLLLKDSISKNQTLNTGDKEILTNQVDQIIVPFNLTKEEADNYKKLFENFVLKINKIAQIRNIKNLSSETIDNLINNTLSISENDYLNSQNNNNSFSQSLENIDSKIALFNLIKGTKLSLENQNILLTFINALNPSSSYFASSKNNVETIETLLEKIIQAQISEENQNSLIARIKNLDINDIRTTYLVQQLVSIVDKIISLKTNNNLTSNNKDNLTKDLISQNIDSDFEEFLTKIDSKIDLFTTINTSSLEKTTKDKLNDLVKQISYADINFANKISSIKSISQNLDLVQNSNKIDLSSKNLLQNEINKIDLTSENNFLSVENLKNKLDLILEIVNGINDNNLTNKLITKVNSLDILNSDNSKEINYLNVLISDVKKVNDLNLTNNDINKLTNDLFLATKENILDISSNINKKISSISALNSNEFLTMNDKKDSSYKKQLIDELLDIKNDELNVKLDVFNQKNNKVIDLIKSLNKLEKIPTKKNENITKAIEESNKILNDIKNNNIETINKQLSINDFYLAKEEKPSSAINAVAIAVPIALALLLTAGIAGFFIWKKKKKK